MTGGPAVNAGLDVSVTGGTIIDTNANGTRILNGELTMSAPNPVSNNTISWTFDWLAPTASGTYTVYAAVLSGNGSGTSNDGTATTSLQVTVTAPTNQPPTAMISGPTSGIANADVTFDGSGSMDPDGTIAAYDWDLGDGTAATGASVTHAYAEGSYTVTLTVTDDAGDTDTATLTIDVSVPNVPPVAEIAGPANGTAGTAVTFDGSASSDPDGNIVAYDWDFGDNTAGSGATIDHIYAAGSYTVALTVTDDMGATDTVTTVIDIAATTDPQPPIANAGGPYTADVGVAVQFDGSASMDPDGTIASYSWDFGDGSPAGAGVGPVHIYSAAGTYDVVLTVTDDQGQTGTAQTTTEISEVTEPPVDPTPPDPQGGTGEELYNMYCASCHGPGGKGGPDGDVVGESADDILDAIDEEPEMAFLADMLTGEDVDAIAAYLNTGKDDDDDGHHGERGYDDDDGHHGKRGDDDDDDDDDGRKHGDRGKDKGDKGGRNDKDSSNRRANPFATDGGSDVQGASADTGGGALHWLLALLSLLWVARRKM
jgi:PKD repeat protein